LILKEFNKGLLLKLMKSLKNLNTCARLILFLLSASPSFAQNAVDGDVIVGSFEGRLNEQPLELTSVYSEEYTYSDLTVSEDSGTVTYQISSSVDENFPILQVALQEGGVIGELEITSVTLIDTDYDTALAAAHLEANGVVFESLGVIDDTVITIEDDGSIAFSLSADLVRVDLETREVLEDQDTARIEGEYSGAFPSSELND